MAKHPSLAGSGREAPRGAHPVEGRQRRRRVPPVVAGGLALLAVACATPSDRPAEPAHPTLTGIEWRLLEFESSDDAIGTIRPGEGEAYTLRLDPDGSLAAGLFCNRGTGRWTSPDAARASGSLTLELKAVTSAACPPSRLERLGSDLAHVRSFVIQDGRLHLNLMLDGGNYVWVPQ